MFVLKFHVCVYVIASELLYLVIGNIYIYIYIYI
jgi:hypothetical protein